MPTVTLNKEVFEKLVGKKLPLDKLKDKISMLGTDLERIEGNEIEVEVFPNRPDMLSEQGFARAFSSFIGVKTGLKKYDTKKFGSKLTIENKKLPKEWPYAVACVIKGLKLDDEKIREIIQLQEKLGTTLTRNRKKGGLGLYPLDKINFPITFTGRKPNEIKFRPLEFPNESTALQILSKHPKGRDYGKIMEGWNKFPVFVDAKGTIMSMPPIINSHDVGKIDETTKDVFVEGTGPDLHTIIIALNILATSLADMGGELFSLEIIYPGKKFDFPDLSPTKMKVDIDYVNKILGLELKEKDVKTCLEKMGYGYEKGHALVPAYRADVLHHIDLVEDIAIAYGYENFEEIIPQVATIAEEDEFESFKRKISNILIGLGLLEANTYHLIDRETQTKKMGWKTEVIEIIDPVSIEYNSLRKWMTPCMINVLCENRHHEYPQKLFEIGRVFKLNDKTETGTEEFERLSIVSCHDSAGFTEAKQLLDYLMNALEMDYDTIEAEHPSFIPGRTARIIVKDNKIAYIGEIHPKVLNNFELEMPVCAVELNMTELFKLMKDKKE